MDTRTQVIVHHLHIFTGNVNKILFSSPLNVHSSVVPGNNRTHNSDNSNNNYSICLWNEVFHFFEMKSKSVGERILVEIGIHMQGIVTKNCSNKYYLIRWLSVPICGVFVGSDRDPTITFVALFTLSSYLCPKWSIKLHPPLFTIRIG